MHIQQHQQHMQPQPEGDQLLQHEEVTLTPTQQERVKTLRNEQSAWKSFSAAHEEFLTRGLAALAASIEDDIVLFQDRAFIHIALGIVYLKNVLIFTWSLHWKSRASLLRECRDCMRTGVRLLEEMATKLSPRQIHQHACLYWTMRASCFHLLPQMMRDSKSQRLADGFDLNQQSDPLDYYCGELHRLAAIPAHLIDYRIMLEFIPFGLDPTVVTNLSHSPSSSSLDSAASLASTYSAIQLARKQAIERKQHHEGDSIYTQEEKDAKARVDKLCLGQIMPYKLFTSFAQSRFSEPTSSTLLQLKVIHRFIEWPNMTGSMNPGELFNDTVSEDHRRKELHIAFLIHLLDIWEEHSIRVRKLLLNASPGVLLPELVNIVGEYLDLQPMARASRSDSISVTINTPTQIQPQ